MGILLLFHINSTGLVCVSILLTKAEWVNLRGKSATSEDATEATKKIGDLIDAF